VAVNLIGMIIAAALWQPLCSTFGMNGINFAITIGYAINAIIALICILLKIKQQGTVKRCK
jgi:hypothetical protein